jgi:hypothetical protein
MVARTCYCASALQNNVYAYPTHAFNIMLMLHLNTDASLLHQHITLMKSIIVAIVICDQPSLGVWRP